MPSQCHSTITHLVPKHFPQSPKQPFTLQQVLQFHPFPRSWETTHLLSVSCVALPFLNLSYGRILHCVTFCVSLPLLSTLLSEVCSHPSAHLFHVFPLNKYTNTAVSFMTTTTHRPPQVPIPVCVMNDTAVLVGVQIHVHLSYQNLSSSLFFKIILRFILTTFMNDTAVYVGIQIHVGFQWFQSFRGYT